MGTDKILCLVTGPSGSGKSSIALELQKQLFVTTNTNGQQVSVVEVIHQDHYFTKPFLPYKERVDDSFENSSGIDWDCLLADVDSKLAGAASRSNEDDNCPEKKHCFNSDASTTIVIVEGHLLGDVASLFRQKFSTVSILVILLVNCSQESCKQRRLDRRKDRSEDERNELTNYIDDFVWPSFLKYGVDAMNALRQNFSGTTTTRQATQQTSEDSKQQCGLQYLEANNILIEIDNSDSASLEKNVDKISNLVHNILSD